MQSPAATDDRSPTRAAVVSMLVIVSEFRVVRVRVIRRQGKAGDIVVSCCVVDRVCLIVLFVLCEHHSTSKKRCQEMRTGGTQANLKVAESWIMLRMCVRSRNDKLAFR